MESREEAGSDDSDADSNWAQGNDGTWGDPFAVSWRWLYGITT